MAKIVSTLRESVASPESDESQTEQRASSLVSMLGVLLILALIGGSFLLVLTATNL